MPSPKTQAENVIRQAIKKYDQSLILADKLDFNHYSYQNFIVTNLLDYFLTQMSVSDLADYRNKRAEGKI